MTGFSIATKFTAVDKFSNVVRGMVNSVDQFAVRTGAVMGRLNKSINSILPNIRMLVAGFGALAVLGFAGKAVVDYDKNLASLSAITGVTGAEFAKFEDQVMRVAKAQKVAAADTADAFAIVGSAQPELLGNAEALANVTEQALILSKAGKMELVTAAEALTKSMNMFGASSDDAAKFIDILATSERKGTATISQLADAMVNVGSVAHTAGLSFEDVNVALQMLAAGGVIGEKAGTGLTSTLLKLSTNVNGKINPAVNGFSGAMEGLVKMFTGLSDAEKLSLATKLVQAEGAKYLLTMIDQISVGRELTGNLYEIGAAEKAADINAQSLSARFVQMKNAFGNYIADAAHGSIIMRILSGIFGFLADNMGLVIDALILVGAGILAVKLYTIGAIVWTEAFAIWTGISAAASGNAAAMYMLEAGAVKYYKIATIAGVVWTKAMAAAQWLMRTALVKTIISMGAAVGSMIIYETAAFAIKIATTAWTFAQWLINAALYACPLVWIIAIIIAAIAAIYGVIKAIQNWGAIMDWLGGIFKNIKDGWNAFVDTIKSTVKEVTDIFGSFGETITDFFSTVSDFLPSGGSFLLTGGLAPAFSAMETVGGFLGLGGEDETESEGGGSGMFSIPKLINPDLNSATVRQETYEKQNVSITVNDENNRLSVTSDNNVIPIKITSTQR